MNTCSSFPRQTGQIRHSRVSLLENVEIADRTFRLTFRAPELVPLFSPGQFVMLRLVGTDDPLLGRPLAIYRMDAAKGTVDVVYLVVGKMTDRLSRLTPGTSLDVWGPLGRGFQLPDSEQLIMVAGGIGLTPFLSLAEQEFAKQELTKQEKEPRDITLLYGASTRNRICCTDDFRKIGVDVRVATDDGSEGYHGFVTDLIPTVMKKPSKAVIVCCGPHAMLQATFETAKRLGNIPCFVSLESPMACGLGICFSCVVETTDDNGTRDYSRTCVDGPVFDAYRLCWDEKTDGF